MDRSLASALFWTALARPVLRTLPLAARSCYTPSVRNGHSKQAGYVLPLHVEQVEDGRFLGRSPKLPGLNVQGDSIAEVVRLAPKVARSLLAAMRAKGVPPPRGLAAAKSPLRVQVLVRA